MRGGVHFGMPKAMARGWKRSAQNRRSLDRILHRFTIIERRESVQKAMAWRKETGEEEVNSPVM